MIEPHASPAPGAQDPGSPPVTICCATADQALVREAADALVARGHVVELAIGVDTDQSPILRAIDTLQGKGLYVLCRSATLERAAIDALREMLRGRDVPFGRTLTLALEAQGARELEERIVSVLRRMVTGRADGRPKAWGAKPSSEDDPDTTVRRPGGEPAKVDAAHVLAGLGTEPENADPYASTSQIEVFQQTNGGVPYTRTEHTAVARVPLPPPTSTSTPRAAAAVDPNLEPNTVPVVPTAAVAAPVMPPLPTVAPAVAPAVMPHAPAVAAGAGSIEELTTTPMPAETSTPGAAPGMPMVTPGGVMAGAAGVSEDGDDFEPPLTFGGRMGRLLGSPKGLAAVLGGVLVIVLVVVLASMGGDDEGDDGSKVAAKDEADEPGASKDEAAKADASEDDAAKADASEDDGEEKAAEDGTEVAADDAGKDSADEPEPVADERPRPVAAEADPPDVVAALASREVRAIDTLLMSAGSSGTLDFAGAQEYCGGLTVAGIDGWRVPQIGELRALAGGRMLGKAVYWSDTLGDTFGEERLVLNAKKSDALSVVTVGWTGAKAVCVRSRDPAG